MPAIRIGAGGVEVAMRVARAATAWVMPVAVCHAVARWCRSHTRVMNTGDGDGVGGRGGAVAEVTVAGGLGDVERERGAGGGRGVGGEDGVVA